MKLEDYEKICQSLQLNGATAETIQDKYSHVASLDVLKGIEMRICQITSRKRIWKFDSLKLSPIELWNRFENKIKSLPNEVELEDQDEGGGGCNKNCDVIVKMAKQLYNVPPCYLARAIVKGYVEVNYPSFTPPMGCDIDCLLEEVGKKGAAEGRNKPSSTKWYRDPTLIPHKLLSKNVLYCHKIDPHCSPSMDEYRNKVGMDYENILNDHLRRLDIPFMDEPAMRKMGYARTPDTILLEPLSIDGRIIKWIESKAWFGDPPSHHSYLKDQYWPYYNRFGPGLVIYWFGFVDDSVVEHLDKGVMVMDHFPKMESIIRIESPMLRVVLECSNRENKENAECK